MGFEESQPQPTQQLPQQPQIVMVPYPLANQQFMPMPQLQNIQPIPINPQYVPVPIATVPQQQEEPLKANVQQPQPQQQATLSTNCGRIIGWVLIAEVIITICCAYGWLLSFWFAASFFLTAVWFGVYVQNNRMAFLASLVFNGIVTCFTTLMLFNMFTSYGWYSHADWISTFGGLAISAALSVISYCGLRHATGEPNYEKASFFVFITLAADAALAILTFLMCRCFISLILAVVFAAVFLIVVRSPVCGHKIATGVFGVQLGLSWLGMILMLSNYWFNYMNGPMGLLGISATISLAGLLVSHACAKLDRCGLSDGAHADRARTVILLILGFVEAAFTVFAALAYYLPLWFAATIYIAIATLLSVGGCPLGTLALLVFNVIAAGFAAYQNVILWSSPYYYTNQDLFFWTTGLFISLMMSAVSLIVLIRQRRCARASAVQVATADA